MLNEVNTLPGHDLVQPLSPHDGRRGTPARRGDRPAHVVGRERTTSMSDDFVFVDELVPGVRWDAKYATWDNFTGKPVDGYLANRIVGTRTLCAALWSARATRPQPSASVCCCGTAIARSAPWTASCAGHAAGGRPHEAAALPEHRPGRDVRARVRRREVGPQPGQHRRPDALPPGHRRAASPWAATTT